MRQESQLTQFFLVLIFYQMASSHDHFFFMVDGWIRYGQPIHVVKSAFADTVDQTSRGSLR